MSNQANIRKALVAYVAAREAESRASAAKERAVRTLRALGLVPGHSLTATSRGVIIDATVITVMINRVDATSVRTDHGDAYDRPITSERVNITVK